MDAVDKTVGEAIALYRRAQGWTQAELAKQVADRGAALAQQTIAKIEGGTRPLKLSEAVAIADVLGVKIGDLLEVNPVGMSRLIIDFWSNELDSTREILEHAIEKHESTRVSAATIVVRGEGSDYGAQIERLRARVRDFYDYDGKADAIREWETISLTDKYERVKVWEIFGGDGDPAT